MSRYWKAMRGWFSAHAALGMPARDTSRERTIGATYASKNTCLSSSPWRIADNRCCSYKDKARASMRNTRRRSESRTRINGESGYQVPMVAGDFWHGAPKTKKVKRRLATMKTRVSMTGAKRWSKHGVEASGRPSTIGLVSSAKLRRHTKMQICDIRKCETQQIQLNGCSTICDRASEIMPVTWQGYSVRSSTNMKYIVKCGRIEGSKYTSLSRASLSSPGTDCTS